MFSISRHNNHGSKSRIRPVCIKIYLMEPDILPSNNLLSFKNLSAAPWACSGISRLSPDDGPWLSHIGSGSLSLQLVLVARRTVGIAIVANGRSDTVQLGVTHLAIETTLKQKYVIENI